MKITFYSIIMAVFSSGALIGIIYKVRKKACFSKRFGYICIVLMYLRERYVTATNHEENVTKAVAGVQ